MNARKAQSHHVQILCEVFVHHLKSFPGQIYAAYLFQQRTDSLRPGLYIGKIKVPIPPHTVFPPIQFVEIIPFLPEVKPVNPPDIKPEYGLYFPTRCFLGAYCCAKTGNLFLRHAFAKALLLN